MPALNGRECKEGLINNKNNLLNFFDNHIDFLWILDEAGCILNINQTVKTRLGFTEEDLLGKSVLTVHPPEQREEAGAIVMDLLQGNRDSCPVPIMTKDGAFIPVETYVFRGFWDEKPVLFGVSRDVSKLKISEEKFAKAFHSSPAMIGFSDIETGEYLDVNQAFCDVLGFEIEEVIGKKSTELLHLDEASRAPIIAKLKDLGFVRNEEAVLCKKDGTLIDVLISAEIIEIQGRKYNFTSAIDITAQKKYQKAVVQTERLAAISDLASGVAHDFNNALQGIMGNVELAELESPSGKVLEYLQTVKSLIHEVSDRVNVLQQFSQNRSRSDSKESVDLNTVADEGIAQTRHLWKDEAHRHGIKIDVIKTYGDHVTVNGCRDELQGVVYNLIKNSIQAMPMGGIITLETRKVADKVYLSVSDDGVGMDEEKRKKVFQPFFSTVGFEQGRGLGLTWAYSIIKACKGDLYVKDSNSGKGITFEIELPYVAKAPNQGCESSPKNKVLKVLCVDDDAMIRDVMTLMLAGMGHAAAAAASGAEALALLNKDDYDLMITDIGMPEMSGWQLLECINGKYPEMIVTVLTGWGDDIAGEKKNKYAVDYVLGKPASREKLATLIKQVIDLK